MKRPDGFINAKELAKRLGVSASLVYKRAREGRVWGMVEHGCLSKYKHRLFREDSRFIELERDRQDDVFSSGENS